MLTQIVAHCRAGFEAETARDLTQIAAAADATIDPIVTRDSALVTARIRDAPSPTFGQWSGAIARRPPIFARSIAFGSGPEQLFDRAATGRPDRLTPLVASIERLADHAPFCALWLEYPDTNDGKSLSTLAHRLDARLKAALREKAWLIERPRGTRLHVIWVDGATAYVGVSDSAWGSPWPAGIPRLKLPRDAPSRSTLKLGEAIAVFLGPHETELLRAGMRAVDLGAAPGGWTWQLAHRGLRVDAVDNGPLKGNVALNPRVRHIRADGFTFRPRTSVDWLVCDIVEQPIRVARLVADWVAGGLAARAIFNLKLPMKKRYEEVSRCRRAIEEILDRARTHLGLRFKQLYHDREEVTGYLAPDDGTSRRIGIRRPPR